MIELKHLRLIDTVARVGSLNKASEELCLTQSALSHQLKDLEDQLGVAIFHRRNSQLHFTPEGKEIREAAAHLLEQFHHLEKRVREIGQSQLQRYVHGYSQAESKRLNDQAQTMSELLHYDSYWEEGAKVLEVGCGVGAQTQLIGPLNPLVAFTSVDLSEKSLELARKAVTDKGIENVSFRQADTYDLPFEEATFDHVFVCFVLEHLEDPLCALREMKRVLKKGGTLTAIEGDHGSTYFHPDSPAAQRAVQAQVQLQASNGGNANIGRQLYPLLQQAGMVEVQVDPRQVYVDASKPDMVQGFIGDTFTAMIRGIEEEAVAKKIISPLDIQEGIKDLLNTMQGGTFCYTFFKGFATRP